MVPGPWLVVGDAELESNHQSLRMVSIYNDQILNLLYGLLLFSLEKERERENIQYERALFNSGRAFSTREHYSIQGEHSV